MCEIGESLSIVLIPFVVSHLVFSSHLSGYKAPTFGIALILELYAPELHCEEHAKRYAADSMLCFLK